jgi:nucleotide-binding universal stress UspA family protein
MTRFESILVATDFSPAANHAVRRAAILAEEHACPLTLLHVLDPAGSQALRRLFPRHVDLDLKSVQLRGTLRRFAKEIIRMHGIAVKFELVIGDAFDEILRASERADLVVLGQHGAESLRDRVLGSTADRLVRHCRKPLLVVKRPPEHRPYRRILVPVDFTAVSEAALGMAAALSQQAAIDVFHARGLQRQVEMQRAGAPDRDIGAVQEFDDGAMRARMQTMAEVAGLDLRRVSTGLGRGDAWRSTLDQEKLLRSDVIVAGKQGRSTMADFLLGSVTRRLMAHSTCDLLIVPRAAAEVRRPSLAKGPSRPSPWGLRDGAQQRLVWK